VTVFDVDPALLVGWTASDRVDAPPVYGDMTPRS
jgi:hypothetical protein